jgi:hypothetical protein
MTQNLNYYSKFGNEICLVVGFLSPNGQVAIKKFRKVQVKIGENMISPRDIISDGLKRLRSTLTVDNVLDVLFEARLIYPDNHWYYFDHKWPDFESFVFRYPENYVKEFSNIYHGFACQNKPKEQLKPPFPYFKDPPYLGLCEV